MKMPTAMVTRAPARSAPIRKRISMASMLRTKLSLKAEKNWHQNSGANRRDRNRVENILRLPAM